MATLAGKLPYRYSVWAGREPISGPVPNLAESGRPVMIASEAIFPEQVASVGDDSSNGVTQLLTLWGRGDAVARDALIPLVYDELHRLAKHFLSRERPGHTLQSTALVHEAYVRLMDQNRCDWQSRTHFFGVAATIIRNILVDHARARAAAKRGGPLPALSLDEALAVPQGRDL